MRRVLRIALIVLASVSAVLWAGFYIYINALACAFGNPNNQRCHMTWPWQLHGEDLAFLVLWPGAALAAMLIGIWLLRPRQSATCPAGRGK